MCAVLFFFFFFGAQHTLINAPHYVNVGMIKPVFEPVQIRVHTRESNAAKAIKSEFMSQCICV